METELVTGTIERITFHNADNGYTILKLKPDEDYHALNADGTLTVVGNASHELVVGDRMAFEGFWDEHPKYGQQLKFLGMKKVKQKVIGGIVPSKTVTDSGKALLLGTVLRLTYYNEENSWGVIKIEPDNKKDYPPEAMDYDGTIAVVGVMPEVVEGELVKCTGKWVNNEQYGKQFKAEQVVPIAPHGEEGIISYLKSHVPKIGPKSARKIYNHFGSETLEILELAPERIKEVGLSTEQENNFLKVWSEDRVERNVMIGLQNYGISSKMAKKIYDQYKSEALSIVQTDPYQLADEVYGIGFKKADVMATGIGIQANDPARLRAGLVYTLSQMSLDGHTYAPREVLIEKAQELLGVEGSEINLSAEIDENILQERLREDKLVYQHGEIDAIYLPIFYGSERGSARRLLKLAKADSEIKKRMADVSWDGYLVELAKHNNVNLSDHQQSAVKAALTSKVSILTGGPGTGKTTTLQMVINALQEENFTFMLASPTGRAAKRLSEATGYEAKTIHRLLGWIPNEGRFDHDEENPLTCDMIVIDEASMIDIVLFNSLLKAIPVGAHLLLVGDVDQLPSVGAGNVLNDVIASGIAQVTRLSQIFRQDDSSLIVTNAHRINNGDMPIINNDSRDFFFFNIEDPAEAGEMIVDIVVNRLGSRLENYDPINTVQVIAPMYKGGIGVNSLNTALQETLNPGSFRTAEMRIGGKIFRRGDKVMQTKNNYDKEVFNGDIGIVRGIHVDENSLEVVIDGRDITYSYEDADEQLIHAYCISTHRSQGSEYPVVIMPVAAQHWIMLQRNLLYTAITRAKKMVILVGTRKAIAIAVNNNKVAERYSGLFMRLQQ